MKRIAVLLLLSVTVMTQTHRSNAQMRTMKPWGIVWQCFQPRVPSLTMAPPYRGDMTLDCFVGYFYFDSLMRSLSTRGQVDSLVNGINTLDTLKPFLRYLYALTEYDDILFHQYLTESYFLNPSYSFHPAKIYTTLQAAMTEIMGSDKTKTKFLVNSGPILHIIVDGVETQSHRYSDPHDSIHVFQCVWGHVLDTIKGLHFQAGECFGGYRPNDSQHPQDFSGRVCINFSYDTELVKGSDNEVITTSLDTSGNVLPCVGCYGTSSVMPGGEYVVALVPRALGRDSISDIYAYQPFTPFESTGGIFPVVDGMVQDPDNFFGYGTSVALSKFESNLKADIQLIRSY